ncbi:MAG: endonuclease, partial [Clostridiales Family XIII bacterium]|nr:endonuclease [Clostridiales Family XIII bacterium]
MVGAVLTQNTAWRNVEKAVARFADRLSPWFVAAAREADLAEIIRPAGFFNQKAAYLKTLTAWFARYAYSVSAVRAAPLPALRAELLALRGIGKETADSILLYAFGFPVFVIDAYTLRLLSRLTASAAPL